jgi:hypothetical protein
MAFSNGYSLPEAQQAVTLSAIAYQGEDLNDYGLIQNAIEAALGEALGQGTYTSLVWLGISSDFANLLYVVQDTSVSNRYALVARGTDWNFLTDWVDDFDVLHTHNWPSASPPDPSILVAQGSWDGLQALLTMTSQPSGLTLCALLKQLSGGAASGLDLMITGHSLGGALATILGLYLADSVSQWAGTASPISLKTYTFASPTTGNQAYVNYYNGRSGLTNLTWQAYRVFNQQDMVPFAYADVEGFVDSGVPFSFFLGLEVAAMAAIVQTVLDSKSVSYVQVGNGQPLNNNPPTAGTPPSANPAETLDDFVSWVLYEHSSLTYMQLFGLSPDGLEDHSTDMSATASANQPRLEARAAAAVTQ